MVKKIKVILYRNLINHANEYLEKYKKNIKYKIKFHKLNYKYVNKQNKKMDLKILKSTLSKAISMDISGKYKDKNRDDYNKILIKKVLEEEKGNKNIVDFLNLSFYDWINVFTFQSDYNNDIFRCDFLKSELANLKDEYKEEIYFTRFIFYLFNYSSYINLIKGRNRINDDKNKEKRK